MCSMLLFLIQDLIICYFDFYEQLLDVLLKVNKQLKTSIDQNENDSIACESFESRIKCHAGRDQRCCGCDQTLHLIGNCCDFELSFFIACQQNPQTDLVALLLLPAGDQTVYQVPREKCQTDGCCVFKCFAPISGVVR